MRLHSPVIGLNPACATQQKTQAAADNFHMRNSGTQKNKIRTTGLVATVLLLLLTLLLSPQSVCAPSPSKAEADAPPNVHAVAAIVINRDTGATLWAKNPDQCLPPASTTKIATGFLLTRDLPPVTLITTSPNAAQTPGHALGMKPDETFHAQDLLYAILLASANDASVAAAERMAGREASFAARMNAWAQASGALHTHFVNSSGLPAPNHYSTAHDLACLARAALQNPTFANVVRTRTYSLPRSNGQPPTLLTNENTLLETVPGMEGVKAGWTREAGFCFVGAVSRNGLRLITVVLNSPDWQHDTVSLLNYGFATEPVHEPSTPQNGDFASAPVTGSGNNSTSAGAPVSLALPAIFSRQHAFGNRVPRYNTVPQNSVFPVNAQPTEEIANHRLPISSSVIPHPSSLSVPPTFNHFWLWAFMALLLLVILLAGRKGKVAMPDFWFTLFGKRRKSQPSSGLETAGTSALPPRGAMVTPAAPEFSFIAPLLARRSAGEWLESVLDTPTRLLETSVRRQARAILDADPHACEAKTLALLQSLNMRLRVVGAELAARHAPRLAEETLLALLKEESVNAEVRADAVHLLAEIGGDRHERLWLQMLLRDGSAPAASMLARLPRLEEATIQALKHVLTETSEGRAPDTDLKRHLRNAHIACVLLAQGHFTRPDAAPFLNAVPANHGEPIVTATLRGSSQPEAIESLVEIVFQSHAYPALQALLEADPRRVRPIMALQEQHLDRTKQSRAIIAKWLLWGEGSEETIQQMATAGNDLARGALQLARMHRRDPAQLPPDALLAAVQIYSLRLGFSDHASGDIALAFRKAASDGETHSLALLPPELQPLAQAYAHPDVYDAVQFALHGDDGLPALLATLARHLENPQYRRELAFWHDKVEAEHRLLLLNALCSAKETSDEETTRTAIEALADDPTLLIRNLALRWLHAHPDITPVAEECLPSN